MLRGMMVGAAAVVTSIVASAPALGQVALRTGLVEGRQIQFDYIQMVEVAHTSARPEAEPTTELHSLETRAQFVVQITKASPDGTGEGTVKVRSMIARQTNPDGPLSVAFDFANGVPAGGEGIAGLEAALASATIVFDVDATGQVTAVRGLDAVQQAMSTAGQVPQPLRVFLDPAAMTQMLTVLFHAEGGIGDKALGASWETALRVPFGPAGALELNTTNVLQLANDGIAAIAGVTRFDLYVPKEPAEGTAKVELGESNGQALTQWDLGPGGLISHTNTQNIATTWTVGELKVNQTQNSKTEIKRSGN